MIGMIDVQLGAKEEDISMLNAELKEVKYKLHIQKSKYEGYIKKIRESYESKIMELQTCPGEFGINIHVYHSIIHSFTLSFIHSFTH